MQTCRALQQTGVSKAHVGEHLNQRDAMGRLQLKVMVANRTREIRPSGMTTGASGNVGHGGNVNPPRNRKGGAGNPPPTAARARDLSKPHAVAYSSDVIELSAQRLVIEKSTGERVSEIGYVLAQDPSGKRRSVHKVRLLPGADVIALARRREAILKGRIVPRYTSSQGLCSHCAYRAECKPDLRDRG